MTFHVRLVSAPDRTGGARRGTRRRRRRLEPPVLPGAAHGPAGDAVQFDVRPRSANAVFRHLQAVGHDHSGTVAVEYVDATLGEGAPASERFLVQRDVMPVWEVIGILTNSQILIVGAMVVGPEYNAIMGIALGIDKRTKRPVIRGVFALLAGFSAAMILARCAGDRLSRPSRRRRSGAG